MLATRSQHDSVLELMSCKIPGEEEEDGAVDVEEVMLGVAVAVVVVAAAAAGTEAGAGADDVPAPAPGALAEEGVGSTPIAALDADKGAEEFKPVVGIEEDVLEEGSGGSVAAAAAAEEGPDIY